MPGRATAPDNRSDRALNDVQVGQRLREIRTRLGISLRALADSSGLNINTLSLIENERSSPSVSTLQQIATALDVPIIAFFAPEKTNLPVVFTPAHLRPETAIGSTRMANLAENLSGNGLQPFLVVMKPGMGSGDRLIVHTGYEFVYCLSGCVRYQIQEREYRLSAGDSLAFEARLPHCWQNCGDGETQILLLLSAVDQREETGCQHFSPNLLQKESAMKIAFITDDSKTISQHFGRAQHYLIVTLEDGKEVSRELKDKMGHGQFHGEHAEHEHHGEHHGHDGAAHNKHVQMAEAIAGCSMVVCGGMGMGAYESMRRLNIQPVVTDFRTVEDALKAFLEGKLVDHTELLH